ncbi:peptidase M48 Ste24p [Clostridium sp. CAG:306]|jgi:peptidase M48 ste24p|nr:peptidase M48 Ste24p [Clostridium sp. CAG:306]
MKKILGLFLALVFGLQLSANAATTNWTTKANVERVNRIGKALLAKNNLPTKINFKVIETDEVNAFANADKEICVYTGMLKFVQNDAELAGVIAHEIGHIVNNHVAKQNVLGTITATAIYNANMDSRLKAGANAANNLTMLKMSRTEEYEADVTGVDLMTKAGYNPLAMVSVLYKISGNYADFTSTHPSGDKRTMYIYDYITYTYPAKAKLGYTSDSYKKFMAYAGPIVKERNADPKKLASFKKKQAKLKEKRIAKLEKYKTAKQSNGWDKSLNVIRFLSE